MQNIQVMYMKMYIICICTMLCTYKKNLHVGDFLEAQITSDTATSEFKICSLQFRKVWDVIFLMFELLGFCLAISSCKSFELCLKVLHHLVDHLRKDNNAFLVVLFRFFI